MAVLLTTGVAVDYARSQSLRTSLQNDLDAAVLGGALNGKTEADIKLAASKYFSENWKAKYGLTENVVIDIKKLNDTTITGTARAYVPTTIMALAGVNSVEISVASEIELTGEKAEIALVIDITDSMSGAKIDGLKQSAKALIDEVFGGRDADKNVKVSLVPFSDHVNVGTANRNASWMSVQADSSEEKEYCADQVEVIGTSNCRMETFTGDRDGVPYTYEAQVCDYQYGPPTYKCTKYTDWQTWNGCAASRDYPLNTQDDQYGTPVPGAMNAVCGPELTTLTNDANAMKASIDNLSTIGNTFIPSGLMWGWATLSKDAPFEDAVDYDEKIDGMPVEKIMVVMTDGANTRSPDYVNKTHYAGDITEANKLTTELCANIKAKGIKIYTVAFDVTDTAIVDILAECATSPGHFYQADDVAELKTAFENIGENLTPLRIAK